MSTIKSSNEDITLNADGSGRSVKFQANGVEVASIDSSGALTVAGLTSTGIDDNATSTAITIDASEVADFANMPEVGGDAVIAKGSNANGTYIKYADGTMICISSYGMGGFTHDNYVDWTYPIAFYSGMPSVYITPTHRHNWVFGLGKNDVSYGTSSYARIYCYAIAGGGTGNVTATAIGVWK